MARYVDGFVIPIPTRNVPRYRRIARRAGEIWMEYGAVEYIECVGDDLDIKGLVSFKKLVKVKKGETVLFSFIVYRSRADRDKVNARVLKDPRIANMMTEKDSPFDMKRMTHGGFRTLVDLQEPL